MRVLINLAIMVFISGGVEVAYALENCSVKSDQMDRSLVRYVGGMRYQLKSSSSKSSEVSYDCVRESSVIESVATSILYSSNIEENSSNIEENIVASGIVKPDAIVVVIDDFGYRNDWVLELSLIHI